MSCGTYTQWNITQSSKGTNVNQLKWLNLEPIIQSETNQKEKNIYHILMPIYTWNREKWYQLTFLQGRNRATDVENGLVDTTGGEWGTS